VKPKLQNSSEERTRADDVGERKSNLVSKTEEKFEKFLRREKSSSEIFEKFDHDRKKLAQNLFCCEQKVGWEIENTNFSILDPLF
jgi:hypothetical protein